jgi:cytoskeletal protein CcmA (bactofilin family)
MWFKQNDPKSPQQAEPVPARPQPASPAPVAPGFSVETVKPAAAAYVAPATPLAAVTNSRLTPGLTLKGEISGREDLWIGGKVDGKVRIDGARVVVGVSGKVHGDIEAREIVVEGGMDGDLLATERLEITTTGNMRGGASAPRIALQEGALFSGTVEVVRAGESGSISHKSASATRAAQAPRGPRFQTAQAAGAAAGSAPTPAGKSGGAGSSTEQRDGETSNAAASVLHRGIASDTSETKE